MRSRNGGGAKGRIVADPRKPRILRCPTCNRRHKRSNPQNARYWLLLHAIAEKLKPQDAIYSAETWHTYFKSRFLGCEEIALPNGKVLQIPNSTADLEIPEFADYMTKVEVWANEHGVWLEDVGMAA